jgi:hypothetical protein
MNKLLIATGAFLSTSAAFAGDLKVEPEMSSSGGDGSGALILLAIVGIVIATSTMAGRAKAEKDPYLVPTDEDDS